MTSVKAGRNTTSSLSEIPAIAVIMTTYNGEKYLAEQLDSILAQKGVHVELFVRDDGSADSTKDILTEYARTHDNIHLNFGSNVGAARSFINELINAPDFCYYAFSDQDDLWYPDKLVSAFRIVRQKELETSETLPILYHSNIHNTDSSLKILRTTRKDRRLNTLECAVLFRCIVGCTMLMNARVRAILKSRPITDDMLLAYHDSCVASVVYAFGGIVICDHKAYILHRVHGNNISGIPVGITNIIKSTLNNVRRRKEYEIKIARAILEVWGEEITDSARKILQTVSGYKKHLYFRLKIVLSPKFRTGDIRLTVMGKIRALIGWL